MSKSTIHGRNIKNTSALRKAIANGQHEFELFLQFGLYSRKTIKFQLGRYFKIINHIDGSRQLLTGRQLYTHSNIGKGMKVGVFFLRSQ